MHCLILAGGAVTPEDPLYAYTQGGPKALIDMGGRTMLERVVSAVQSSAYVEDVLVVGVEADVAARAGARFDKSITMLPDHGAMIANLMAGIEWFSRNRPEAAIVLGCSADIPTINGEIVDDFIEACRPWDKAVYYNFITRDKLEARFPHSNRTYSRLGGHEVAGGDMVIARLALAEENRELVETLTGARKQPWRIARIVGLRFLAKFLLRRVTIADVEKTMSRIIGAPARIILDGPPELAMDADKPFQIDMLRTEFVR
jgi:molybdopterin-guanine dinucleotide biosynthesis protein A